MKNWDDISDTDRYFRVRRMAEYPLSGIGSVVSVAGTSVILWILFRGLMQFAATWGLIK